MFFSFISFNKGEKEMDSEQKRSNYLFDNQTHSKLDVNFVRLANPIE